jgi:general stress protein 26
VQIWCIVPAMRGSAFIKVLDFLRSQKLAVISTHGPTKPNPESALIAYAEDDQLNLYFQTGRHTRKAANIKANPHISLVIGLGLEPMLTVQYEGTARQLTDSLEIKAAQQLFYDKNSPTTREFMEHPTAILFKVTPTWIGCSDYTGNKPQVIEITNFPGA